MTAYHAHDSFHPTAAASKGAAKLGLFATLALAILFLAATATKNPSMAAIDATYATDSQTDNGAVTVLAP